MDTVRKVLKPLNVDNRTVMIVDNLNNLLFSIKSEDTKQQALEVYGSNEVLRSGTRDDTTVLRIKKRS